jgi:uncharacterized surface protein with fasciclin (FAS1) repeats
MNTSERLKYRILLFLFGFSVIIYAQDTNEIEKVTIQDVSTHSHVDIVSFLSTSKEHSTFLKLLKATGVDEMFSSGTSFTLFAPTNAGFEKLPKGTVENLLLPENKYKLINILQYHIIAGNINTTVMSNRIKSSLGKAKFKTKSGGVITIFNKHGIFTIEGEKGKGILIENPDKLHGNGFVHIVDTVLIPG